MKKASLLSVFLLAFVIQAEATTIKKISFSGISKGSELIVEGVATTSEVKVNPENNFPVTFVTFKVLDVVKGNLNGNEITLRFVGGELPNGDYMRVSGSGIPAVGEHGVYFIESSDKKMLNPLLGWQQGRYLVQGNSSDALYAVPSVGGGSVSKREAVPLSVFKQRIKQELGRQ